MLPALEDKGMSFRKMNGVDCGHLARKSEYVHNENKKRY